MKDYGRIAGPLRIFANFTKDLKPYKDILFKEDREFLRKLLVEWCDAPVDPTILPLIEGLADYIQANNPSD